MEFHSKRHFHQDPRNPVGKRTRFTLVDTKNLQAQVDEVADSLLEDLASSPLVGHFDDDKKKKLLPRSIVQNVVNLNKKQLNFLSLEL